jgi:GNAT superfamily N-acetyltransferase
MAEADLAWVVREHRAHFPDGFFARLGPAFLTAYYRAYAFSAAALAYVAEADGRVVGYLVGVTDPVIHRRDMIRRRRRSLLWRGLVALSIRPPLTVQFLRTRAARYARKMLCRSGDPSPGASAPPARVAVLGYVAVTATHQSRGAGSALVERFLSDAEAAGCDRATLVTLSGAGGAGPYYQDRGWQAGGRHTDIDGRLLTTYEWRFARPGADRQRP